MTEPEWTPIEHPQDPRIDVFMGLRDRELRARQRDGLFIAEGDTVIGRARDAGYRLVSMLVDAKRRQPLELEAVDVPVYAAADPVLEAISGFHQYRGAMGCFERQPLPELPSLLSDEGMCTVVVTEGVVNPTNMGVILRSAAGLGVDAIVADPTSVDPLSRRCCRVSMGEGFALPHTRSDPLPGGFEVLRSAGFRIIALTPGGSPTSTMKVSRLGELHVAADDRVALVIGAEGAGLTDATLVAADVGVSIEMSGRVDSLNAGAAAAIAFYAVNQARTR